jgi:large subunit ribosomal protein L10
MNRQEKIDCAQAFKKDLQESEAVFLIGVQGLTVEQSETLRKGIRSAGGSVRVVKNTLLKKAVVGIPTISDLTRFFKEQIAVVTVPKNATIAAKIIYDFAKENEKMTLVAGTFEQQVIDKATFAYIATLPSKDVLIARICGALKSSLIRVAYVLSNVKEN